MDLPSDAIRAALKRHPLPPTTLATRLGLPMSTVSRFVKGETAMTLRTLDTLWPELGLEIRPIRTRRASKPAPKGGK